MIVSSRAELDALVRTGQPPAPRPLPVLPCAHRGDPLSGYAREARGLDHARDWRGCGHPARPLGEVVCPCMGCGSTCPGYAPDTPPRPLSSRPGAVPANRVAWWDETTLAPGAPGKRFNPSLIRHAGRLLLAYRDGWQGSDIHVQRLTDGFAPDGPAVRLELRHARADYGREDPRLFVFNGRLHVSYIGVEGTGYGVRTNQMYARLSDDLHTQAVYAPHYAARNEWEKNWSFFQGPDGDLYAVYAVGGHRVLRIDGDRATLAHQRAGLTPWAGGEPRGGAAPVMAGDEYWSFFHDRIPTEAGGLLVYRCGLYTFDLRPPFAPRRWLPVPVLSADPGTRGDNYAAVCFPGGAVRDGDRWLLAVGAHDRWSEVWSVPHADLERALVPIPKHLR